jgi:N-acetylglucosamine-6-phosphate deacetylase
MMQAVKNCVMHCSIETEEALRMASLYPARILTDDDTKGIIKRNYEDGFVVFDDAFNVIAVI